MDRPVIALGSAQIKGSRAEQQDSLAFGDVEDKEFVEHGGLLAVVADGIGGHDLALGSGSFDGLVGTGFNARWKRLFLNGAMQYAIRTEGDFGYQYANDWIWHGGPGVYLMLGEDYTIALQAAVSGESKSQDTLDGAATEDTAITSVYLGPQLNFTWSGRLSAQLAGDLPVSIASTGDQIVPDYRIRAAVTWRF